MKLVLEICKQQFSKFEFPKLGANTECLDNAAVILDCIPFDNFWEQEEVE